VYKVFKAESSVRAGRYNANAPAVASRSCLTPRNRAPRRTPYNPVRPEPSQRNVVVVLRPEQATAAWRRVPPLHQLLERYTTIPSEEQLCVLACDGPGGARLDGALRPDPFTAREVALLRRIVPALTRRLATERPLAMSGVALAAFEAVLEAVPAAVYFVGARDWFLP
jgi:hypothetical protein